jgi:MOSC domain-containing protein YiiM
MNDPHFLRRFAHAGRPGAYLRILKEGELAAGDSVEVLHRPQHGLTVADVSNIYLDDHSGVERLLEAPELATSWHDWARGLEQKRARGSMSHKGDTGSWLAN